MKIEQSTPKCVKATIILLANICFAGFAFADGSGFRGPQDSGPSVAIESNFEVSLEKIRRINKLCISKGLADVLRPLIDSEYGNQLIEATKGHTYSDESDSYAVEVNASSWKGTCSISRLWDWNLIHKPLPLIFVELHSYCTKTRPGGYGQRKLVFNRQNIDHIDLTTSTNHTDFPYLKFEKRQLKPIHFTNGLPDKSIEVVSGISVSIPKDMKDIEVLYQLQQKEEDGSLTALLKNTPDIDPKNTALIETQLVFNSGSVVQCLMNGLKDGTK